MKDREVKKYLYETNGIKTIAHCKNRINHILHKSITLSYYTDEQLQRIIKDYNDCRNIYDRIDDNVLRVANNVMRARQKRSARVREYLNKLCEKFKDKDLYFLTLTFNNGTLQNTSDETRRKYVERFLNNINDYYIANIDFGKKKEREHYHAIISIPSSDLEIYKSNIYHFKTTPWEYGIETCKKINKSDVDLKRLSIYIDKFVNHTIKETTKNHRVIYSKALKDLLNRKELKQNE